MPKTKPDPGSILLLTIITRVFEPSVLDPFALIPVDHDESHVKTMIYEYETDHRIPIKNNVTAYMNCLGKDTAICIATIDEYDTIIDDIVESLTPVSIVGNVVTGYVVTRKDVLDSEII